MTLVFGLSIITIIIFMKYKPVYSVNISGSEIGTVTSKSQVEETIDELVNKEGENILLATMKQMPEYKFKFTEPNERTNEEEVLLAVKNESIIIYKMYAITLGGTQKAVVKTQKEAEDVVQEIKNEFQQDLELDLSIIEIYDTKEIDHETVETALAKVNDDDIVRRKLEATVNGITLSVPTTGTITSRFGGRRSGYHTGLDIANNIGTDIKACSAGTVAYAGYKGSYGNLVIISHDNGVETYYAHCSELYVKEGQVVKAEEVIAAMGSTGNSTGSHLHLEVRVDGRVMNPQNYLYK